MTLKLPFSPLKAFSLNMTFLLTLSLLLAMPAQAAQVEESVARRVAAHFLADRSALFTATRSEDLTLVRTVSVDDLVYYRIYNAGTQGFVVVTGDDIFTPVLGYSTEGAYGEGILPINAAKWFEFYEGQIAEALTAGTEAAPGIVQAWSEVLEEGPMTSGGDREVNPLCQTQWDQQPHVNALCPGGSVTGCVATGMAQVMKYHNHPAQGAGFHSYNETNYGTLSANFGATTYEWANMPNVVNSPNNAVATLMYHCGVSVDMVYSPQVSGAWMLESHSPTTDHNSQYALRTYFGYANDMQGVYRNNYQLNDWNNLLKGELDASRPILYAGFGPGGGHCFVCDGYDNNNFFHFNWGWGGQFDGFFAMDALNPGGQGTGGGSGQYNSNQEALINIRPATSGGSGGQTADMSLYNFVTPSSSTIYYGEAFSVSTNILNNGTTDFSGDYCAAAFDAASNFYGFIQTYTGQNLSAGFVYNNDLVFSSSGLFSMVPGTYYIGIFYRTNGGEWTQVADNGGYTNFPQITVINPSDMEVSAAMTPAPGNSVTQGGQLSVNLNIYNNGFGTFFGQYGVALYNLDGTWAQDIGVLNESQGLPVQYEYLAPYLTFGPANVTVPPGTYLMACQHNFNNTGWQLTGSTLFQNPIFITVTGPSLSPDQYEVNNNAGQAYTLPVNFSGNLASTNTTGSNLHVTSDLDFFKVVLAAGNDYAITARIHDSYNSGNGNTYTLDGLWSWSTDGSVWSTAYDDVMPGAIVLNDGGTVYFQIAPYFAGETGTYLLQLDIERGFNVGVDERTSNDGLSIYPNPGNDHLVIDATDFDRRIERAELIDAQGRLVQVLYAGRNASSRFVADIGQISVGTYMLRLVTDRGMHSKPVIIAR